MIALVEGAERQKTPNGIALSILIAGLTLIVLLAVVAPHPFSNYSVSAVGSGSIPTIAVLVSLLVCLIPTTIGGLLSAIGIAGTLWSSLSSIQGAPTYEEARMHYRTP